MDSRKKRGANYTETEKSNLLDIVRKHTAIIESRQCDGASNKKKQDAWKNIETEFNRCSTTGLREWRQLRFLWENLKKKNRKSILDGDKQRYFEKLDTHGYRETDSHNDQTITAINKIETNGKGGNIIYQVDDTTVHVLTMIEDQIAKLENPFEDGADYFGIQYKEKWDSVRAQQQNDLNKQKIAQSISDATNEDQMQFFKEYTKYETETSEAPEDTEDEDSIEKQKCSKINAIELPPNTPPSKIRKRKKTPTECAVILQPDEKLASYNPIDTFFSLMASSVKNFEPLDQHSIKTKVFALVSEMEEKYLLRSQQESTVEETPFPAECSESSRCSENGA